MNEIIEYVRNRKRQKVGVLVGSLVDGQIAVGWSQARISLDPFDAERGKELARIRMHGWSNKTVVPHSIRKQLVIFSARCLRYFKGKEFYNSESPDNNA